MTRAGVSLITGALGAMLVMWSASVSADDQDNIDYRQHIMKAMGEEAASIDMILQHKVPPDSLATHARILAIAAAMAKKAFEPKSEGGNSKPGVWSNWTDFSKRLDALTSATDELAKTAATGGIAVAGPKVEGLGCKACHDQYMAPKN